MEVLLCCGLVFGLWKVCPEAEMDPFVAAWHTAAITHDFPHERVAGRKDRISRVAT